MAWLSDWAKRLQIEIQNDYVDEDLTNFPVMIALASGVGLNSFNATDVFDELTPLSGTLIFSDDFSAADAQWDHIAGTTTYASNYMSHDAANSQDRTKEQFYFGDYYDVTMRFRVNTRGNVGHWAGVHFCYDAAFDNYQLRIVMVTQSTTAGSTYYIQVRKKASSGEVTLINEYQYNYYNDYTQWFWVRALRHGNDLYCKVWRHPAPEPRTWTYEVKNAFDTYGVPTTGYIRTLGGSVGGANFFNYDDISFTRYDDPAKRYDFSKVRNMAVTLEDGETQLPVEIESWSPDYKVAYLWTKVPTISSGTNTVLYLYYDKTQLPNDNYVGWTNSNPSNSVWDSDFVFVTHCNSQPMSPTGGTAGTIYDSSSYSNDHTAHNMDSNNWVLAPAGLVYVFNNAESDRIDFGNQPSVRFTDSDMTVEALCKPYSFSGSNNRVVASKGLGYSTIYRFSWAFGHGITNRWFFQICQGGNVGTTQSAGAPGALTLNQWYYVVGKYKPSTYIELWVDNVLEASNTSSIYSSIYNSTDAFMVGCGYRTDTVANQFDGEITEVRLSKIIRSEAWLKATRYALNDQLTTMTGVQLPPSFYYDGYIKENGAPAARTARLYLREDGQLMDEGVSDPATGYYYLTTSISGEHFIVAFDDELGENYNALILDRLVPKGIV